MTALVRSVLQGRWQPLFDESGQTISGVRARAGVAGVTASGVKMGADLIEMQPGSAFPLHTHPGDHVLYVVRGVGLVQINAEDHPIAQGDTILIPAQLPHGVSVPDTVSEPLTFLAMGVPHRKVSARDRMKVVDG